MLKFFLFFLLSIGSILLSWASLRNPKSHGFYRFFAFELILALTLLNVDLWFSDPFSPIHLLSWFLLFASLVVVILGFYTLRKYGKPEGGVDETTVLVKEGIYRFIRHPLYTSLFLFTWGIFLKKPWLPALMLAIGASLFLFLTAKFEEKLSLDKFGTEYAEYMKHTKMMVPYVI